MHFILWFAYGILVLCKIFRKERIVFKSLDLFLLRLLERHRDFRRSEEFLITVDVPVMIIFF